MQTQSKKMHGAGGYSLIKAGSLKLLLITLKKQFRRHQKQQSPETETYNRSHAFLQETEGKKKHETRTCKNKVPLIKRTLPHVFFTLSYVPISRNYSYVMFQLHRDAPTKGKQG